LLHFINQIVRIFWISEENLFTSAFSSYMFAFSWERMSTHIRKADLLSARCGGNIHLKTVALRSAKQPDLEWDRFSGFRSGLRAVGLGG
jgi:hypothetical protein